MSKENLLTGRVNLNFEFVKVAEISAVGVGFILSARFLGRFFFLLAGNRLSWLFVATKLAAQQTGRDLLYGMGFLATAPFFFFLNSFLFCHLSRNLFF
jgi:hypothetical protein